MNQGEVALKIRRDLRASVDLKYKEGECRYFKEKIKPIGVRSAVVGEITQKYFLLLKKEWKYEDFVRLGERLLKDGWFEEIDIAFSFMERLSNQFTEEPLYFFEAHNNSSTLFLNIFQSLLIM